MLNDDVVVCSMLPITQILNSLPCEHMITRKKLDANVLFDSIHTSIYLLSHQ